MHGIMERLFVLNDREVAPATDFTDYVRCQENEAGRRVGETKIGQVVVSTVFMGFNFSIREDGVPVTFETMIFGLEEGGEPQVRYATWAEAEAGHARAVEWVKSKQVPEANQEGP